MKDERPCGRGLPTIRPDKHTTAQMPHPLPYCILKAHLGIMDDLPSMRRSVQPIEQIRCTQEFCSRRLLKTIKAPPSDALTFNL
ncbi:hypothetical protein [Tabrizicola sp. TH137]|uniref:hypothetical protein n=1 Tax=Tabrizicola sp. TH137 TaxID=2067452 RepID=UPI0020B279B7|nr:hypothetical protein [Tabrizicola sp. TH137]